VCHQVSSIDKLIAAFHADARRRLPVMAQLMLLRLPPSYVNTQLLNSTFSIPQMPIITKVLLMNKFVRVYAYLTFLNCFYIALCNRKSMQALVDGPKVTKRYIEWSKNLPAYWFGLWLYDNHFYFS